MVTPAFYKLVCEIANIDVSIDDRKKFCGVTSSESFISKQHAIYRNASIKRPPRISTHSRNKIIK